MIKESKTHFYVEQSDVQKNSIFPVYALINMDKSGFFTQSERSKKSFHSHSYFECFYIVSGASRHYINNNMEYLTSGFVYILHPNIIHAFEDFYDSEITLHRDLCFETELFKEVSDFLSPDIYDEIQNTNGAIRVPIKPEMLSYFEDLLQFCEESQNNPKYKIPTAKMILSVILHAYQEQKHFALKPSSDFKEIFEKAKSPIVLEKGISALGEMIGYSGGHLCRLFKKNTGKTLSAVLTMNRMTHAAFLFQTTNKSIIDIAAEVGYNSMSQFIATFKKYYNMTPNKYRKSLPGN